jgi:hypothetical protein
LTFARPCTVKSLCTHLANRIKLSCFTAISTALVKFWTPGRCK